MAGAKLRRLRQLPRTPRETFDGTLAAQKFLSCVYRLRQASRFGVGLNHIIEVLTGGASEKVHKWGHDKLSTYGIGKEHSRSEWQAIGRELIRLGFCRQSAEKFSTIELTEAGLEVLRSRKSITLTKPMPAPDRTREKSHRAGEISCDESLFDQLRMRRKQLADERDVPAYIIFSDVSLRLMARDYPVTDAAFARITGVGERKRAEFGAPFLAAIREHLAENPRQVFAADLDELRGPPPKKFAAPTARESWTMFAAGKSFAQIATARGISEQTVAKHIADAVETGESFDLNSMFTLDEQAVLSATFVRLGDTALAPVKEALGDRFDYNRLHLFRAALRALKR